MNTVSLLAKCCSNPSVPNDKSTCSSTLMALSGTSLAQNDTDNMSTYTNTCVCNTVHNAVELDHLSILTLTHIQ